MASLSKIYRKNPDIVFRKVAEESILVPVKNNVADMESIYVLNEVACRAWELIDGKNRVEDIRDRITEEFEVAQREAGEDLLGLLGQLEKIEAIF